MFGIKQKLKCKKAQKLGGYNMNDLVSDAFDDFWSSGKKQKPTAGKTKSVFASNEDEAYASFWASTRPAPRPIQQYDASRGSQFIQDVQPVQQMQPIQYRPTIQQQIVDKQQTATQQFELQKERIKYAQLREKRAMAGQRTTGQAIKSVSQFGSAIGRAGSFTVQKGPGYVRSGVKSARQGYGMGIKSAGIAAGAAKYGAGGLKRTASKTGGFFKRIIQKRQAMRSLRSAAKDYNE